MLETDENLTSKKVPTNAHTSEIHNKHHPKWGNGFPFQPGTIQSIYTITASVQYYIEILVKAIT